MSSNLAFNPHHDGSARFVEQESETNHRLRVVVPREYGYRRVLVRVVTAADAICESGYFDCTDGEGDWWVFALQGLRLPFSYSFIFIDDEGGQAYLNACGMHGTEQIAAVDFHMGSARDLAPEWARASTAYYLFLDRFSRGGSQDGIGSLSAWSEPVKVDFPENVHQFYGGDLAGVVDRLGYLDDLGVNMLMLSPFFPAPESHRYCATSFSTVDETLGGDAALARLTNEVHTRGMRCVGDFTVNHCGAGHPWFEAAMAGGPDVDMFYIDPDENGEYATYKDVPTLPKFNYTNELTAQRLFGTADSPLRRWLREPYNLDGWRLDAAAMVARHGVGDANARVARDIRTAMSMEKSDSFHVAEILHDPASDLLDGRWSGSVMCAGFATPVRTFVAGKCTAEQLCSDLRQFAAAIPWQALISSVTFVGCHDMPRIHSVAVSEDAALAAHFMLMAFPGIPMIYAGDEMAVTGVNSDAGRVPLPWNDSSRFNNDYFSQFRALIHLRGDNPWLSDGGFRWLAAEREMFAFERVSTNRERLVFALATSRGVWSVRLPALQPCIESVAERGLCASLTGDGDAIEISSTAQWSFGVWRLVS